MADYIGREQNDDSVANISEESGRFDDRGADNKSGESVSREYLSGNPRSKGTGDNTGSEDNESEKRISENGTSEDNSNENDEEQVHGVIKNNHSEDNEKEDSSIEDKTEEKSEGSDPVEITTTSGNGFFSIDEKNDFVKGIGLGLLVAAIVAVVVAIFLRRKKENVAVKSPGMPMILEMYSGECLTDPGKLELRDGVILGSSKKCDVRFEGEGVEPEHAKIVIQNGQAYIVDMESKNGVTIGGMRIQDRNPLRSGYVIGLGEVEFLLKY